MADGLTDEELNQLPDANTGYSDAEFNALPGTATDATIPGDYVSRFASELTSPEGAWNTITAIPGQLANAGKGVYSAITSPVDTFNNYFKDKTVGKVIGDVGSTAARVAGGPFFPITGGAFDKLVQYIDPEDFPATSPEEDAAKLRGEGALSLGGMGIGATIRKGAGILNDPQRAARMMGASSAEMNPLAKTPVQDSVKMLEETSPEFRKGVMGTGNITKAFEAADGQIKQVGQAIEKVYPANKNVTISLPEIEAHPDMKGLFDKANSTSTIPKVAQQAQAAYEEVMTPLRNLAQQGNGNISIKDLWDVRKSIDDIANLKTANPSLSDEFLSDARTALKDSINNAIDKVSPADAAQLKALNEQYHNLYNVRQSIAKGVGSQGGKLPFVDDKSPISLSGTIGKLTGLGTNTGRAAAYNAGQLSNAAGVLRGPMGAVVDATNTPPTISPDAAAKRLATFTGSVPEGRNFQMPGMQPGMAGQAPQEYFAPEQQQEPLLPRETDHLTADNIESFLMKASQEPQAPIAIELVNKMRTAYKAGDMDTIEKIHSDMTRLFPDLFEPGQGVNGKLFYPDDQKKYMDNLEQLNRMGQVDSIHLAKQRNAFNNPQDSRVLPIKPSAPSSPSSSMPKFHEGTRVYAY